jgi:hypothetical protein
LFNNLHDVNAKIIQSLKDLKKNTAFDKAVFFDDFKSDQFIFAFPLTPMSTHISYPLNNEFSFKDLLDQSKGHIDCSSDDWLFFLKSINTFNSNGNKLVTNELDSNTPFQVDSLTVLKYFNGCISTNCVGLSFTNNMFFNIFRGGCLRGDHSVSISLRGSGFTKLGDLAVYNGYNSVGSVDSTHQCVNNTTNEFTSGIVVDISKECVNDFKRPSIASSLKENFLFILELLTKQGLQSNVEELFGVYEKTNFKARIRRVLKFKDNIGISLTITKNTYIIAHYNAADLSILSDFNDLKSKLSIVNKSFVSLGKPLRYDECFVYIRDSMLLAPAGSGSLASLGKLYENEGNFSKINIKTEDLNKMSEFLARDRECFEKYALQDAIITLKHSTSMEVFNMTVKQLGIPLTLSSIGRNYVFQEWDKIFQKYIPYQISGDYLMGNVDELQTPKGLFASRDVGAHMSYYIANYKGGRNESFMYGAEDQTY